MPAPAGAAVRLSRVIIRGGGVVCLICLCLLECLLRAMRRPDAVSRVVRQPGLYRTLAAHQLFLDFSDADAGQQPTKPTSRLIAAIHQEREVPMIACEPILHRSELD